GCQKGRAQDGLKIRYLRATHPTAERCPVRVIRVNLAFAIGLIYPNCCRDGAGSRTGSVPLATCGMRGSSDKQNVRLWPKADISSCAAHVRFRGVERTMSFCTAYVCF